jgi:transcriptional regulator with XRE-family HTH domain
MTPLRKSLAARVSRAMTRKRWDVSTLAQRAGLNPRTVQRFLDAETFSEDTADALAKALREDLTDSGCPDSASERQEAPEIAKPSQRPVVGWKAASQALGVPISTLRLHRRSLGDRKKRPWWSSVEALRFWYDGLVSGDEVQL